MALWLKNEVKLNHAVAVQGRDNCAESSSHCVARDRLSESGPFAKYFCFFPEKNVALNELMAVVLALSQSSPKVKSDLGASGSRLPNLDGSRLPNLDGSRFPNLEGARLPNRAGTDLRFLR